MNSYQIVCAIATVIRSATSYLHLDVHRLNDSHSAFGFLLAEPTSLPQFVKLSLQHNVDEHSFHVDEMHPRNLNSHQNVPGVRHLTLQCTNMDGVLNDWHLVPSMQGRHTPLNTLRPEKRSPGTILLQNGSALSISCIMWSDALVLGLPEEEAKLSASDTLNSTVQCASGWTMHN